MHSRSRLPLSQISSRMYLILILVLLDVFGNKKTLHTNLLCGIQYVMSHLEIAVIYVFVLWSLLTTVHVHDKTRVLRVSMLHTFVTFMYGMVHIVL